MIVSNIKLIQSGLEACSDADHATHRSTTGVICHFAEGAVSWFSQNKHLFRFQPQRLKLQLQVKQPEN